MKIADLIPGAKFHCIVFSSSEDRAKEVRNSMAELLDTHRTTLVIKEYRNGFFPFVGAQIKEFFEEIKKSINPDLIFTHFGQDKHQDHRTVSELTWNTFRDHLILEYEIPKFDGDLGAPNVFFTLEPNQVQKKIDALLKHYRSQHDKQWFSQDTFMGLLRLRGIECNSPTGLAEGFYSRKMVIL
jgi:LmbE family N-acetylglucosaminyl deacetylase